MRYLAVLAIAVLSVVVVATPAAALPCRDCSGDPGGPAGTSTPAKLAAYTVGWDQFGRTVCSIRGDQQLCGVVADSLPGNDDISVEPGPGTPGTVRISLQTSAGVTWFKQITAVDTAGRSLGAISRSGSAHDPVAMVVPADRVVALVFTKAGFLGFPFAQYDLRGVSGRSGSSANFSWTAD